MEDAVTGPEPRNVKPTHLNLPLCSLALGVFFLTPVAAAEEYPSVGPADEDISEAFESGFRYAGHEGEAGLEVARFGPSYVFTALSEEGVAKEIVCLLCTTEEVLVKARGFGAALHGSVENAEVPPPLAPSDIRKSSVRRKLRPAAVFIGLGLSAVVLGGVFMSLDGECADPACGTPHKTKGLGIGLLSAGLAIDVAAIVWLLVPNRENPAFGEGAK